jgi:hypothetical protein
MKAAIRLFYAGYYAPDAPTTPAGWDPDLASPGWNLPPPPCAPPRPGQAIAGTVRLTPTPPELPTAWTLSLSLTDALAPEAPADVDVRVLGAWHPPLRRWLINWSGTVAVPGSVELPFLNPPPGALVDPRGAVEIAFGNGACRFPVFLNSTYALPVPSPPTTMEWFYWWPLATETQHHDALVRRPQPAWTATVGLSIGLDPIDPQPGVFQVKLDIDSLDVPGRGPELLVYDALGLPADGLLGWRLERHGRLVPSSTTSCLVKGEPYHGPRVSVLLAGGGSIYHGVAAPGFPLHPNVPPSWPPVELALGPD